MTRGPSSDPETGRRTSDELTEARTVLSRAENALGRLRFIEHYGYPKDPQHDQIKASLTVVVTGLEKYRRTGRPRKEK